MEFEIAAHHLSVYTITIAGRLDANATPRLKEVLRTMTRDGSTNFVVDLRDVTFIDSTGLGVLTSLLRAARAADGTVRLVLHPDSALHNIISIVRFDHMFDLYETPDQALSDFRF
ncbi:MAG: anti-sigma factor antagonist BldG [Anaerolineae bacterium]